MSTVTISASDIRLDTTCGESAQVDARQEVAVKHHDAVAVYFQA
jgi:hypothetical protein